MSARCLLAVFALHLIKDQAGGFLIVSAPKPACIEMSSRAVSDVRLSPPEKKKGPLGPLFLFSIHLT